MSTKDEEGSFGLEQRNRVRLQTSPLILRKLIMFFDKEHPALEYLDISRAEFSQRLENGEHPLELLPQPQEPTYSVSGDTGDAFTSFIVARQNSARPLLSLSSHQGAARITEPRITILPIQVYSYQLSSRCSHDRLVIFHDIKPPSHI